MAETFNNLESLASIRGKLNTNATELNAANASLNTISTRVTATETSISNLQSEVQPVTRGGTGATSAFEARTNLGVAIGTDVQAFNANLASLSGLAFEADRGLYTTGANTAALFTLTAAGRALLDDADAAAQRTTLGLGTGNSPTFAGATLNGALALGHKVVETVFTLINPVSNLNPANGTIQVHTLTDNATYTDLLATGESITLMIDDGAGFTVTWPTMTWVNNGGLAPTLATSGYTVVVLWKVGSTLYGALVGDGT